MTREIHHGIVHSELDTAARKSCVIFNRRYCLAPASVLISSFDHIQNEIKQTVDYDILHNLKINRIIATNGDQRSSALNKYKFKIIYEHQDILYESDAHIVNIFKCRNIWNSFNDILRNFVVRSAKYENNDLQKLLLSSFIILRMSSVGGIQEETPLSIFKEITTMTANYNKRTNVFYTSNIQKLENIESISTPFGNECFLNTINVGRIANIFGDNKCLMVASMPLVNGCEGSAVYNKSQDLVGIVVSTTFDWNSENATLTLVAKFNEIMAEFVEQSKLTCVNIHDENEQCNNGNYLKNTKANCRSLTCAKDSSTFENFIVLIQSSDSWGSGCFVKINEVRVVITCAHVFENHNGKVHCTWKLGHFQSNIIFKNPHFDEAFDIAILDAPPDIPEKYFTRCYQTPTKIGQTVYSSGFPHFTSLGKADEFFPSIFEGHVTKISNGVIFSDASVQSGQSG